MAHLEPTRVQTIASLVVGNAALLVIGLQPIWLGGLAAAGRVSVGQLGLLATIELLAIGLGSAGAAARLPARDMRRITALAALLMALADGVAPWLSGAPGLMADRAVAGLAEGVLVWSVIEMIARARQPETLAGVFLTSQTLVQVLVSALIPVLMPPQLGVDGVFAIMTLFGVIGLVFTRLAPDRLRDGPLTPGSGESADPPSTGSPPRLGLAALGIVFFQTISSGAVWAYLQPLALRAGLDAAEAGLVVPATLSGQVLGGLVATILGARLPYAASLIIAASGMGAACAAIAFAPWPAIFWAAYGALGFLWLFSLPYHARLLIEADPTRRAATFFAAAQLVGSSLGATSASLLTGAEADLVRVPILAGLAMILSLALMLVILSRIPNRRAADP